MTSVTFTQCTILIESDYYGEPLRFRGRYQSLHWDNFRGWSRGFAFHEN